MLTTATIHHAGRHSDELVVTRQQPDRDLALDTLARIRADDIRPADMGGIGRWMLCIPNEDWLRLRDKYPAMASRDPQEKSKFYLRFMRDPESAPFRVRCA